MAPSALQTALADRTLVIDVLDHIQQAVQAHPRVPIDLITATRYLARIDTKETELMEVHKRIVLANPADLADHQLVFAENLQLASELYSILHGVKSAFPDPASAIQPQGIKNTTEIRLPRLDLPKFDGAIQDWVSFRDMFVTSVHNNASISKSQKLTYLKSLVHGEAARQLRTMVISDANYDIAWQQLIDRYQNDRELLFAIIRRFVNQPSIQQQSPVHIRTLIDTSQECIRSLAVLNIPKDKGMDVFIMFHLFQKLDTTTKELWEQNLKDSAIPETKTLLDFLEQRARALAAGGSSTKSLQRPNIGNNRHDHNIRVAAHHTSTSTDCKVCNSGSHPLFKCPAFHSKSIIERFNHVKKNQLCFNCLSPGHSTSSCSSSSRCRLCQKSHHTLIHKPTETPGASKPVESFHTQNDKASIVQSLLATALVSVPDYHGQPTLCTSLCDGGSTSTFITEECVNRLKLPRSKVNVTIKGICSTSAGTTKGIVSIIIKPHFQSNNSYNVSALIVNKITDRLPSQPLDTTGWSHLNGLQLADPDYHKPKTIDILLGSDIFYYLLRDGQRFGPKGSPVGFCSTLGWLIAGHLNATSLEVHTHIADVDLDHSLQRFWEIESLSSKRILTSEEQACEDHFASTHSRDENGRFTVSLPWKNPKVPIGTSREFAVRRLKQMEKRLSQNISYHQQYHDFLKEYLSMGHMELVSEDEVHNPVNPTFFIPHHFVLKGESTTTKFRVVFDGSLKSTSGNSLNDAMMVGPTLQDNLVDIITRFRCSPIAFTADIAKMYRQIRISTKDADLQRILWRESTDLPIREYRLLTVTYGTASAPYLATKALHQLAQEEAESFPAATAVMLTSFYIDDLMSGAESLQQAIALRDDLITITNKCGFPLRKWYSNDVSLIQSLPPELRGPEETISINIDQSVKTLGIRWNTTKDKFEFKSNFNHSDSNKLTKRIVLSEMSKLFDPLGWLSPILIVAKILMQSLWKLNLGWDELLPENVQQQWSEFKLNLKSIDDIQIPRCMIPAVPYHIRLAGFCDASEAAYAAVVFLCCYYQDSNAVISLISSKTRVAPAKQVSLPRLELCGAHLLSKLVKSTEELLKFPIHSTLLWTDSTVVLAWINSHPSRWQTFVANRVTEIQNNSSKATWNHVKGIENPADCASRGFTPKELQQHSLWWTGPSWLSNSPEVILKSIALDPDQKDVLQEERRVVIATTVIVKVEFLHSLLKKFSNLIKLKRITAWLLRYNNNCNKKNPKATGPLTPAELEKALLSLIKATQQEYFLTEINCCLNKESLPSKSRILPLNPFLDDDGVLKVGGRLRHAPITREQKHPTLLPRHSLLTQMLIMSTHLMNCHAGVQLVLSTLTQKYWIVRGRDAVRFQLKKCVKCTRHSEKVQQQLMGDLPSARLIPSRPFLRCGVDYAGPFLLRPVPARSKITFKAYMAIFVCFVTRAIHVEIVTSLSTDAFLAVLRRFSSRRGKPSDIFSDCGTNFIGANKELQEIQEFLKSKVNNQLLSDQLSKDGIHWHFNPPGAPHMGGLWEAGVKSIKFHLRRVLGETRLTFEEMSTVICQIEACLNSRPLTALSADPDDLDVLTPGHFLIGGPLNAVPDVDLSDHNKNRLSRWQLLQQFQQVFWKRWSSEFLTRLQQRPKWMKVQKQIKENDLVLIKNELMPPMKWKMGRVISIKPGADDIVRVVTIRTADGSLTRPISKLVLLPLEDDTIPTANKEII